MNYLRVIRKILAPGGVWINIGLYNVVSLGNTLSLFSLGPLLWHWENNNTNDLSIELDLEEVKALCRKLGFKISVSLNSSCALRSLTKE